MLDQRQVVPVPIDDADTLLGLLDPAGVVGDAVCDRRGVVGLDAEVDVEPAAGVGEAEMWLPQLQRERAGGHPDARALLAAVDRLEAQLLVERDGAVEGLDLQDDLEDAVDPGAVDR